MVDASPSDLSAITLENSTEETASPRCLSPVLNSTNIHRKSFYNRKKSRSRVKLSKRFANSLDDRIQSEPLPDFNKTISDIQNCNDIGDRLLKIKEFETEKRNCLSNLYATPDVCNRKTNVSDFIFKKPDSPVCFKKIEDVKECNSEFQGFRTGSGKKILIAPEVLKKKNIEVFGNIWETEEVKLDFKPLKDDEDVDSVSDTQLMQATDVVLEIIDSKEMNDDNFKGFTILECKDALELSNKCTKVLGKLKSFIEACGDCIVANRNLCAAKKRNTLFDDMSAKRFKFDGDFGGPLQAGFSRAGEKAIKISGDAWKKVSSVFGKEESVEEFIKNGEMLEFNSKPIEGQTKISMPEAFKNVIQGGFTTGAGVKMKISESALKRSKNFFDKEDLEDLRGEEVSGPSESINDTPKLKKDFMNLKPSSPKNTPKIARRRLGISGCKQIVISNEKLQKAKSILEEDSNFVTDLNTPIKFKQNELHSSTPLKDVAAPKPIDLTPVKKPSLTFRNVKNNSIIIIQEPMASDFKSRFKQFDDEREALLCKIKIMEERQKALELQENLIKNADEAHRRPKQGALWVKKMAPGKTTLKELCRSPNPVKVSQTILEITPKNAKYVQLNCNSDCNVFYTIDGAVVIPNPNNFVSVTEIQTAFEAMPGVDPRLLPQKWISNHFKWIVWKLASLERTFPDIFPNLLTIENIIQQLKYRYDREIDRAERPALRRILEKDDIPQKRMVLCVCDIIEVSPSVFELKLTDGWYSIQTIIDQPLCKQILASKIVIGTKLVLQCAELLNCEGCHPLEALQDVRLKITYNCTRRAVWYAKLGYQRISGTFPIPLRTINMEGGTIAMIKMVIARVYPLRYMEKQGGNIVWRNKKAEDKRAQEWALSRMKEMEVLHQKVQEGYEKEINSAQKTILGKIDFNKIAEINSPKLLYEILENTNDPEGFKNKMSSEQLSSALEYRSNIYTYHQQEIASRIAEQINEMKSAARDVTSVLKLRIIDGSENSNDNFVFNIWKPTEDHLEALKEGRTFSVFNVLPKPNGDLTANSRTHFKPETSSRSTMQRCILAISSLQNSEHKPPFNEYDTVGTIVETHKDDHTQDLWLTDSSGMLLHIKVMEGSAKCCLFDNLNRGQAVAVMNLIFRGFRQTFAQALANQCTLITGYPQHRFLQDGLIQHSKKMPKDLVTFLNECDKKIAACAANNSRVMNNRTSSLVGLMSSENVSDLFDDSSEDNTLIQSRLTTTDVAMSLIDTDQFL